MRFVDEFRDPALGRALAGEILGLVEPGHAGAPLVSARFHNALAEATAAACERVSAGTGLSTVVLAGGVFQNRLLLERTYERLAASGLRVLLPERLPPNDGAISYGQAAIAAALDAES